MLIHVTIKGDIVVCFHPFTVIYKGCDHLLKVGIILVNSWPGKETHFYSCQLSDWPVIRIIFF